MASAVRRSRRFASEGREERDPSAVPRRPRARHGDRRRSRSAKAEARGYRARLRRAPDDDSRVRREEAMLERRGRRGRRLHARIPIQEARVSEARQGRETAEGEGSTAKEALKRARVTAAITTSRFATRRNAKSACSSRRSSGTLDATRHPASNRARRSDDRCPTKQNRKTNS